MDTYEFLKRTALFRQLEKDELHTILATAREREFEAGAVMVHQGDPGGRAFYMILEGKAEVRAGGHLLAEFGPGDYFGEIALVLDDTPRTADVTAITPTRCLLLTQWDFRSMLTSHPEISRKIMDELARRLRDTDRALSE